MYCPAIIDLKVALEFLFLNRDIVWTENHYFCVQGFVIPLSSSLAAGHTFKITSTLFEMNSEMHALRGNAAQCVECDTWLRAPPEILMQC
jgi:hypothetical protein